jgi:hypothetical protein
MLRRDSTSVKVTNFKIFGFEEDQSKMLFGMEDEESGFVQDEEMQFYKSAQTNRTVTFA